jgi:hypothetical protein
VTNESRFRAGLVDISVQNDEDGLTVNVQPSRLLADCALAVLAVGVLVGLVGGRFDLGALSEMRLHVSK